MGSIMAVVILRQLDLHLRKLSALITTKVVSLNPVQLWQRTINCRMVNFFNFKQIVKILKYYSAADDTVNHCLPPTGFNP
jgi:hypothetical protein